MEREGTTKLEELIENIFRKTYNMSDRALYYQPETLEKVKAAVKKLRTAYKPEERSVNCESPYSDEEVRKAYMLAYYPYLIEPAYKVVSKFVAPNLPQSEVLNLDYFASGPCPELYGTVKALSEHNSCDKVSVYHYDCEDGWLDQLITTRTLCGEYMDFEESVFASSFDIAEQTPTITELCKSPDTDDVFKMRLENTNIVFLQNYFMTVQDNDYEIYNFLKWFKGVATLAKVGTFFVLIDMDYNSVRRAFSAICNYNHGINLELIASNIDSKPETLHYDKIPYNFYKDVFTDEEHFREEFTTNYYYLVLKKI